MPDQIEELKKFLAENCPFKHNMLDENGNVVAAPDPLTAEQNRWYIRTDFPKWYVSTVLLTNHHPEGRQFETMIFTNVEESDPLSQCDKLQWRHKTLQDAIAAHRLIVQRYSRFAGWLRRGANWKKMKKWNKRIDRIDDLYLKRPGWIARQDKKKKIDRPRQLARARCPRKGNPGIVGIKTPFILIHLALIRQAFDLETSNSAE